MAGEYACETNSAFLGFGGAWGGCGLNLGTCEDGSCFWSTKPDTNTLFG